MSRAVHKQRRQGKSNAPPHLLGCKLVLCLGNGGVGKTSTAAALAYAAARRGSRCALITVDPAKRLRSALGLDHLSNAPQQLAIEAPGELHAMALDTKRAFDDLIERVAPNAAIAAAILDNPLYQELSNELGGSTEYMAMEKLHELLELDYDLVVVDTPPGAHARELLGAPSRIAMLVDSGAASVLRAPSSILRSNRIASAALSTLLAALERWIGRGLVKNLSDFAAAFEPLLSGFADRARHVERTLRRADTAIALVTTAEPAVVHATSALATDLIDNGLSVSGVIVNQVHQLPPRHTGVSLRCAPELRHKLLANYAALEKKVQRDRKTLQEIEASTGNVIAVVPRLAEPVSSLEHLELIASILAKQL